MTDIKQTMDAQTSNPQSDEGTASGSDGEHTAKASDFIKNTSLDEMHAIAEEALRKKMEAPPKWVFPEGGIQPGQ
ncbi:MAG: hypothetical protein AAGD25_15705 [Cyanobacteria bacterium P01_F01_bin.150]